MRLTRPILYGVYRDTAKALKQDKSKYNYETFIEVVVNKLIKLGFIPEAVKRTDFFDDSYDHIWDKAASFWQNSIAGRNKPL
jgi:hypothetical protein